MVTGGTQGRRAQGQGQSGWGRAEGEGEEEEPGEKKGGGGEREGKPELGDRTDRGGAKLPPASSPGARVGPTQPVRPRRLLPPGLPLPREPSGGRDPPATSTRRGRGGSNFSRCGGGCRPEDRSRFLRGSKSGRAARPGPR